jgi:hypothetical protein
MIADGSETKYPIMSGFGEDAPSNKWKAKRLVWLSSKEGRKSLTIKAGRTPNLRRRSEEGEGGLKWGGRHGREKVEGGWSNSELSTVHYLYETKAEAYLKLKPKVVKFMESVYRRWF